MRSTSVQVDAGRADQESSRQTSMLRRFRTFGEQLSDYSISADALADCRHELLTRPAEWIAAIDFADADAATARVATEFDGLAPELTALITDGDTPPVPRPLYTLPTRQRWDRVAEVTLVVAAAHLMPPPSGEGANLATWTEPSWRPRSSHTLTTSRRRLKPTNRRCSLAARWPPSTRTEC